MAITTIQAKIIKLLGTRAVTMVIPTIIIIILVLRTSTDTSTTMTTTPTTSTSRSTKDNNYGQRI